LANGEALLMNRFAVKRTFRRGFTLLEMMVVVLIITILLSVTGPAFQRLTRGNAVDASSRMIAAQLRLARAEAISRRTYVAVILPGKDFVNRDATAIYRYQSFRAAIVKKKRNRIRICGMDTRNKMDFPANRSSHPRSG